MSVTASDVKGYFPELDSTPDATVTRWLGFAQLRHDASVWGVKSDIALICLTAHLVTLANQRAAGATGTVGTVQSRTVGDVSVTYAVPTTDSISEAALASTGAGQLYLDLLKGIFPERVL